MGEVKDDVIHVENKEKEMLGYLQYERIGQWMHWCWYQDAEIRIRQGCLQEVRDKQKELLKICNQTKR